MKQVNGIRLTVAHEAAYDTVFKLSRKTGFCWASNSSIAGMLGLSKSYVSHLLTDLERAGWMFRKITLDDQTHEFQYRQLVPLDKLCTPEEALEKVRLMELDHTAKGERIRLVANGKKIGIAPLRIMGAIHAFGAKRVDEALSIVRGSHVVNNPVKLFFAALHKGFIPGKRAEKLVGKAYITKSVHYKLAPLDPVEVQKDDRPVDPAIAAMIAKMKQTAARCRQQ